MAMEHFGHNIVALRLQFFHLAESIGESSLLKFRKLK